MKSINIKIPSKDLEGKIRNYLGVLYKFHKLTDKETDIVVELVLKYYEIISKYPVHDNELISKLLFDVSVKRKIKEKYNIKDGVLQNYLTAFRNKGVIKDNLLNLSYIPPLEPFELKMLFS